MKQYQRFLLSQKYWTVDNLSNLHTANSDIFGKIGDINTDAYTKFDRKRQSIRIPSRTLADTKCKGKITLDFPDVSCLSISLCDVTWNNHYVWSKELSKWINSKPPEAVDTSCPAESVSFLCRDFLQLWMTRGSLAEKNKCPIQNLELSAAFFSLKLKYLKNLENITFNFTKERNEYWGRKMTDISLHNCNNLKVLDFSSITPEKLATTALSLTDIPDSCIIKFPLCALSGIAGIQFFRSKKHGFEVAFNSRPTIYAEGNKLSSSYVDFEKYKDNKKIVEMSFKDLKIKLSKLNKQSQTIWENGKETKEAKEFYQKRADFDKKHPIVPLK